MSGMKKALSVWSCEQPEDVGAEIHHVILKSSVRENAARKESSREKSHVKEQGLMTESSCQAGQGKMPQH
jgi:hypothetical protein